MDYVKIAKVPPASKEYLSRPNKLVEGLKPLIGQRIEITGKSRTNGSNFRKIVTNQLMSLYEPRASKDYEIVPPKGKGVPKFLREYIDTYIVTSGKNYNLQVWNRIPNDASVLVDLHNGEVLLANEVRFVLGKISLDGVIESIIIMTPDYIENRFGKFGKPTIKQQLIISDKKREQIIESGSFVVKDRDLPSEIIDEDCKDIPMDTSIKDLPQKVYPIDYIDRRVTDNLLNETLDVELSTKQRGQELERLVAYYLGYQKMEKNLEGGYPDIVNQMLEVKVQDSPTIDLGRYSPQFEETINGGFTTRMVRYLIALTNAASGKIDGVVLAPGEELGKNFSYVSDKSYKCQRSIPMSFFEEYRGEVVYNP